MKATYMQRAQAAALRRPQTVLWRSILMNVESVQISVMRFRMALSESEAQELLRSAPYVWLLRLAPDLWSQEVSPGTHEWESTQ